MAEDQMPRASAPGSRLRAPAKAWVRPAIMLGGGLFVAVILVLAGQHLGALAVAVFAAFMGYWTSPLRSGEHTPLEQALAERPRDGAAILWTPGDPLSARLQTALNAERHQVTWVNVYRDPEAATVLEQQGGADAIPLVLVGDGTVLRAATVGQVLDALAAAGQKPPASSEAESG